MTGPAAILCEGASILAVTPETLAGQTVIAVNLACRHLPALTNVIATQEGDPRPDAGLGPPFAQRFAGLFPDAAIRPDVMLLMNRGAARPEWWPGPITPIETEATNWELYEAGIWYTHALPTSVVAAMYARRHGYGPVTVYGADMLGTGSPLTPWAPYNPDGHAWDDRWNRERFLFRQVLAGWPSIRIAQAVP